MDRGTITEIFDILPIPQAGCTCLFCSNAREAGEIEWLEPEEIIEPKDLIVPATSPKKQANLRRSRLNKWANSDEAKKLQATEKISLVILIIFLLLIAIYFGTGVYNGLHN